MAGIRFCGTLGEKVAREIARGDWDERITINLTGASYLPPEIRKELARLDSKLKSIDKRSIIDKRCDLIMKNTDLTLEEANIILQEEA